MSRFGIGVVCFLFATNAFAADEGQRRSGFVFRGGLGSRFLALTGDASPATSFSGLSAELSIGWKLDRVLVTVGFELGNITTSTGNSTATTSSSLTRSNSLFLVTPGTQFALVRSADRRVELLASLRFGFGRTVSMETREPAPMPAPPPSTVNTTLFNFMYELAPGLRYWVHPQLGFSLLAGVRGDYQYTFASDAMNNKSSQTAGTNSLFAALQATGVF